MLILNKISVTLPGGKVLFDQFSCTAQDGQRICITGDNGIGKTTLLRAIAGTMPTHAGTIHINNTDVSALSAVRRSCFIGKLFQRPIDGCIGNLTVAQNITLALHKHATTGLWPVDKKDDVNSIIERAKLLGLSLANMLNQPMRNLSGGQQ